MEAPMILSRITKFVHAATLIGGLTTSTFLSASIVSAQSQPGSMTEQLPASSPSSEKSHGFAGEMGASPSGTDVRILPINLPAALRLVDASNPTIALARERINEAYAHWRQAQLMLLPNLQTGPAYARHDGLIQNSLGLVFPTSKWN